MYIRDYRPRIIDATLAEYLETFGAILIEGPKWCGKTWTGRHIAESEFFVADSRANFNNRNLAMLNPDLVLDGAAPRLIDEWQEVPHLFDAVRSRVDRTGNKGQFILTGSTSIDKNAYIHSGTGRIAHLRMRTMSLYESGRSDGKVSLVDACYNRAKDVYTGDVNLANIIDAILIGGWPSSLDLDVKRGSLVAREYVNSLLSEDLYKVDLVRRDRHKLELLLRSLARNEATTAANSTLKKDINETEGNDLSTDTITGYLDVLARLFITENIPPFSPNIRSSLRLKQAEKRHFVDPSLSCALLQLTPEKLLSDLKLLGFLFESLVERDLLTYVEAFGAKLFHYQDYRNNEMDAVIELEDGSWCGIEIKLGAYQIDEAANNLRRINEAIERTGGQGARSLIVICGLTSAAYRRPDGVYVLPITSLRE